MLANPEVSSPGSSPSTLSPFGIGAACVAASLPPSFVLIWDPGYALLQGCKWVATKTKEAKSNVFFISISAPLPKSTPSHVGSRPVPHKQQLYHPFQPVGEDALIIFRKDEEWGAGFEELMPSL